jgi:hypothetical protein
MMMLNESKALISRLDTLTKEELKEIILKQIKLTQDNLQMYSDILVLTPYVNYLNTIKKEEA